MGEENYTYNVKEIDIASGFTEHESPSGRGKKGKKKKINIPKTLQYFDEIKECAENANNILEKQDSPYRLHVYRLNKDIFVDLVILYKNKQIKETVRKNITDRELMKTIEQIETLDGFFVDCTV
jgi:hypothetical protein